MLARSLPLGAAVAAFALAPGVASAAPVQNSFQEGYTAQAEVVLPDGRRASVALSEYIGGHREDAWGELYLEVACESSRTCLHGGSGMLDLTDAQVDFSRSLTRASATDLEITLYGWDDRQSLDQVTHQVTVSVRFEGSGKVTGDASHGDLCWSTMGAACQSVIVDASRSATGTLTLDGQTATGSGSLARGHHLSVGAPR